MLSTKINTKVIDVELTEKRKNVIAHTFTPLTRLVDGGARCDVVIRKIHRMWGGDVYCVLVRLKTHTQAYYAVANANSFLRAINQAQIELRKSINKKHAPDVNRVLHLQQAVHKRYFVELFMQS